MILETCPKCGKLMQRGRLFANFFLCWSPNTSVESLAMIGELERLQKFPILTASGHPGERCKDCRIVIFQYPELKGEEAKEHYQDSNSDLRPPRSW